MAEFASSVLDEVITPSDAALVRAESYDPSQYHIWDVEAFDIRDYFHSEEQLQQMFKLKYRLAQRFFADHDVPALKKVRFYLALWRMLAHFLTPDLDELVPQMQRLSWIAMWMGCLMFPRLVGKLGVTPANAGEFGCLVQGQVSPSISAWRRRRKRTHPRHSLRLPVEH